MGDRVTVDVIIYGHITSSQAITDLIAAVSNDLGQDQDQIAQDILDWLDDHPKEIKGVNITEDEVNYADVSSIVNAAVEHKIDIEASWGSGHEFDGGAEIVFSGEHYEAVGMFNYGISLSTLAKLLRLGGASRIQRYVEILSGKAFQPFSVSPEVRDRLQLIADGEYEEDAA